MSVIRKKSHIRLSTSERVFYIVNASLLVLFGILCLYPLLCMLSSSISTPDAVGRGIVTWYPIGFSLEGYKLVLTDQKLMRGFLNSIFYTVAGTALNVFFTLITAYALSRKELIGRKFINFLFSFTMWFSGGIIPLYLLVRAMHMTNTVWAMLVPNLIGVWYMMVCRTNIANTIPEELFESASLDGCGYFRYLCSILLPLSKAIIAVLALWYAIDHWNGYFNALIFIVDKKLWPLSLYLRSYLVLQEAVDAEEVAGAVSVFGVTDLMKNALIVLSCLPLWLLYPFIQKFMVKGIMVGSVKG